MKKSLMLLIALLLLVATTFAQDASSDTLTVESKGYGSSRRDALNDAIRNAAESSVGILISSNTLIENYIMIKDQILTSANAYVYRYEEKGNDFDKNTGTYSVVIKAFVAKKLLMENTNAKISSNLKLDMSAVEKAKFEMQQMKERAKSAIAFLGAFVQKKYRDVFIASIDSLSLSNKDFARMIAEVKIYATVNVKNYDNFMKEYQPLAERVRKYTDRVVGTSIFIKIFCYDGTTRYSRDYVIDGGDGSRINSTSFDMLDPTDFYLPFLKKDNLIDKSLLLCDYWDVAELYSRHELIRGNIIDEYMFFVNYIPA